MKTLFFNLKYINIIFFQFHRYGIVSRKIWSVQELETLPAGTMPRTSHHRSAEWEAWKEEALNYLPVEDEKGRSSIGPTLELFQGLLWGNSWKTGWSAYGSSQAHRCHLELNWTELIPLNWFPNSLSLVWLTTILFGATLSLLFISLVHVRLLYI